MYCSFSTRVVVSFVFMVGLVSQSATADIVFSSPTDTTHAVNPSSFAMLELVGLGLSELRTRRSSRVIGLEANAEA